MLDLFFKGVIGFFVIGKYDLYCKYNILTKS